MVPNICGASGDHIYISPFVCVSYCVTTCVNGFSNGSLLYLGVTFGYLCEVVVCYNSFIFFIVIVLEYYY
jgi:hypothetical protein